MVSYILILVFREERERQETPENGGKHFCSALYFFVHAILICYYCIQLSHF